MFQEDKTVKNGGTSAAPQSSLDKGLAQNVSNSTSELIKTAKIKNSSAQHFMGQPLKANAPEIVADTIKKIQPTSKIYNAAKIVEQQLLGINRVVKVELIIEGQIISHFKHLKLKQSATKHHEFDVELPYDVLGTAENHQLEKAQDFLGKRLTAIFKYKDVIESPERVFVGVITEVGFAQEQGSLGNIILSGFSPTILLDAAPHIQSFGGDQSISLNTIAENIIKEGIDKARFDYRIDARYGNITYSCQYEETHYNYLARMAEAYGEQFFYDGEVLHFGALPPQQKPVELVYGSNVHDIKVKMKAQHVNPTFYGYNSSKDEKLTTGSTFINHKSDIAQRAYSISQKVFKTPSLRVAPIKSATSMDVSTSQKGTAGSKAVSVFVTSGTTTIPFLYPGCAADIEMREQDSNKTAYFTKLLITDVIHEVDARGYYNGYFEAIAADAGYIPRPEFEMPIAEPQVAKVVSNTDPKKQGRIQVQFDWQRGGAKSEFIRVMTPDAGGSEKVATNRGFMAIPEVGDQVMIAFQHNHPDRPFAMGGMFHGKVGAGGGQGNNIRSFSSKSGNIIKLNDGAGIDIKDKAGNHVTLSGTGNLNTEINADYTEIVGGSQTTNITKSHVLNVDVTSTTNVKNELSINVGEGSSTLKLDNGGNISIESNTNIKLKVGASSIEITASKISITSPEVDINGGGATANFKGLTKITGSQVDIN